METIVFIYRWRLYLKWIKGNLPVHHWDVLAILLKEYRKTFTKSLLRTVVVPGLPNGPCGLSFTVIISDHSLSHGWSQTFWLLQDELRVSCWLWHSSSYWDILIYQDSKIVQYFKWYRNIESPCCDIILYVNYILILKYTEKYYKNEFQS